jgi:hypothetical protein
MLICIYPGRSQNECGLYKNADDLRHQHISIKADLTAKGHAIEISNFFMGSYVYVHTDKKKLKVPMDSIYAVKQYNGTTYRIWQRKCYQLLDSSFLQIFSHENRITKMIPTPRSSRPVMTTHREYYFCCDYADAVLPLTIDNVLLALHADKTLSEAIRQRFKSQQEMIQTDPAQRTTINSFLLNYKQQKQ